MSKRVLFAEKQSKILIVAHGDGRADLIDCASLDEAKAFIAINEKRFKSFELQISKKYAVKVVDGGQAK